MHPAFRTLILSLLLWLVLLLALLDRVQAELILKSGNETQSYPTVDFFQSRYPGYSLEEALPIMFVNTSQGGSCNLMSLQVNPILKTNLTTLFNNSFAVIPPGVIVSSGCMTITAVANKAAEFNALLPALGYPLITAVLIFSDNLGLASSFVGSPVTERYLSHNPSVSDAVPSIITVIMRPEDYQPIMNIYSTSVDMPATSLEQQIGIWNEAYQSTFFTVYTWVMFVCNLIVVIYAMWRLFLLGMSSRLSVDLRTSIFFLGVISVIMTTAMLSMRRTTLAYRMIQQVSTFLFSVAFYLLLLLWSGVLSRVQVDQSFAPLRIMIYLCSLASFYTLVLGIVWLSVWPSQAVNTARIVTRIVIPVAQFIVALLYFIYAVRFNMRRHDYNSSKDTRRALTKLAKLSVIGFCSFLLVAIVNISLGRDEVYSSPGGNLATEITLDCGSLLRAFAIIVILDVKLPSSASLKSAHSGPGQVSSGETSSGWGTWSRGWKKALMRPSGSSSSHSNRVSPDQSLTQAPPPIFGGWSGPKSDPNSKKSLV